MHKRYIFCWCVAGRSIQSLPLVESILHASDAFDGFDTGGRIHLVLILLSIVRRASREFAILISHDCAGPHALLYLSLRGAGVVIKGLYVQLISVYLKRFFALFASVSS